MELIAWNRGGNRSVGRGSVISQWNEIYLFTDLTVGLTFELISESPGALVETACWALQRDSDQGPSNSKQGPRNSSVSLAWQEI